MSIRRPVATCPECGEPYSPEQLDRLIRGLPVICERCGYEYRAEVEALRDILPVMGDEPDNLYPPGRLPRPFLPRRPPLRRVPENIFNIHPELNNIPDPLIRQKEIENAHPYIERKRVLKEIPANWLSYRGLLIRLGIKTATEKLKLNAILSDLEKQKLIETKRFDGELYIRKKRFNIL